MTIKIGKKVLVTTDSWFLAPDGQEYKGVFGEVKAVFKDEDVLGIKTNRGSTNWYAQIGDVTIAGCQIHYAVETDHCSRTKCKAWNIGDNNSNFDETPSRIYFAVNS